MTDIMITALMIPVIIILSFLGIELVEVIITFVLYKSLNKK